MSRGRRTPLVPSQLLSASTTPYPAFNDAAIEEQRRVNASAAAENASQALQRVQSRRNEQKSLAEQQPLRGKDSGDPSSGSGGVYGSLDSNRNIDLQGKHASRSHNVSSPPSPEINFRTRAKGTGETVYRTRSEGAPSLELPGPAISDSIKASVEHNNHTDLVKTSSVVHPSIPDRISRHAVVTTAQSPQTLTRRAFTSPYVQPQTPRSLFNRYFSRSIETPTAIELPLEAFRDFDAKRADFFSFLDDQLTVVADFYKEKEDQAVARFEMLQEQLDLLKEYQAKKANAAAVERQAQEYRRSIGLPDDGATNSHDQVMTKKLKDKIIDKTSFRPTTPSHTKNTSESIKDPLGAQISRSTNSAVKDYTRKTNDQVPYTEARSKLKHALQEFYRNLDMLKSYSMLNREAFRKIIKKYDKTISARHSGKFMSEKVDKAWFVKSDVTDTLMASTENLYAYFERGSHKMAANKLRAKHNVDYSPSAFRNGLFLGAGAVIGIRGLVWASDLFYNSPDPAIVVQTSYLLQIYAGYFLALFLFLAFCVDCRLWMHNRINYVFIFEFDPRSSLDWQQLAEIPSLLFLLLGILMWVNFGPYGGGPSSVLWLYYPVILVGLSICIVFFPFQHFPLFYPKIKDGSIRIYRKRIGFLYPHSRAWFVFSNFRLYTGGIYPVEFRDFFLGDMYCSLTYAMGNIELFFCLYATRWGNPPACNSVNSMLFGFFTCLPGIWRAFQCLRRYKDSRMAFPHLANCAKYICTILFYMTLSLYRLDETPLRKGIFITFATINSIYVSIWDICFDWSLGTHGGRGLFFADSRGRNQQFGFPTWYYYPAVIIDPLLR